MENKEKFMKIPCSTVDIKYLKAFIKDLPDGMEVTDECAIEIDENGNTI